MSENLIEMKKAKLVFIPFPAMGHIVSAVEMAKLLVNRDDRFSITFLIMTPIIESAVMKYVNSLNESSTILSNRLQFIELSNSSVDNNNMGNFVTSLSSFIETQKPHVKEVVSDLTSKQQSSPGSPRLAGFLLDFSCVGMMDVAKEFGLPSYIFYPSNATFLGFLFYMQAAHDEEKLDFSDLENSDTKLEIPSLVNPLPARQWPSIIVQKESFLHHLCYARAWREAMGIVVNTFEELESHALKSICDAKSKTPPVYPVGPLLDSGGDFHGFDCDGIMRWLDNQHPSSVVFLCFGSWGSFSVDQIREIARALENIGRPFLWSLRQAPPEDKIQAPSDYENFQQVLSAEFLDRTGEIGKVVGWAPQVKILAHPAVGVFVSHCGWNSTLESIWFGVPIAAWPLYGEQQFNAFLLVIEMGLAVEIKMDYKMRFFGVENQNIVSAEEIERGLRSSMERIDETSKKMKEMSAISRKALIDGGSSHSSLGRLIQDMIDKMP